MRLFGREVGEREAAQAEAGSIAGVLALASERIRGIADAAERAAVDIRSATQAGTDPSGLDRNQISRERLVADLAEALVQRAEELSRDAVGLADVVQRASKRLSPPEHGVVPASDALAAPVLVQPEAPRRPDLTEQVSDPFTTRSGDPGGSKVRRFERRASAGLKPLSQGLTGSTDGLRLLATQMAVAGSTRTEIETRLRDEFGVKDASALLGDVASGSGSGQPLGDSDANG